MSKALVFISCGDFNQSIIISELEANLLLEFKQKHPTCKVWRFEDSTFSTQISEFDIEVKTDSQSFIAYQHLHNNKSVGYDFLPTLLSVIIRNIKLILEIEDEDEDDDKPLSEADWKLVELWRQRPTPVNIKAILNPKKRPNGYQLFGLEIMKIIDVPKKELTLTLWRLWKELTYEQQEKYKEKSKLLTFDKINNNWC